LSEIDITYTKITKDEQDYKRVIITQRNGTIVTNDYDKAGRLVNRTIQKGENVEGTTFENFTYDGLNRLTYAENDDFVVEFKFDPLNRITEEKQMGKLVNYTYSVVNNLRQMTMKYPNDRLIEKNFDLLDRLSSIKQGDNDLVLKEMKYIGRSYRLLMKQFGNNDVVNYLYDQGRRMTEKKAVNKNSDIINHYKHGYNKVHMKNYEQRMHENGIGDVFGYDAVYRLTNAKFNVPDPTAANPTEFERERNIFLDHVDNITRIDETKNGETTQITTEILPDTDNFKLNQYSRFDQWGLTYDKNGNLTQKGTQKMYFDFRNQAVRVTDGTATTENKYDALGRRLQKIVNTGSQSKTENYYYSGHQVIEVRDGNDQVKRQFIYGNGIDELVRMDAYSGSTITPYYFHTNAIGSTTAVTDANGQVVERYKYGLYGMPTFMDAAGNVIEEYQDQRLANPSTRVRQSLEEVSSGLKSHLKRGMEDAASGTLEAGKQGLNLGIGVAIFGLEGSDAGDAIAIVDAIRGKEMLHGDQPLTTVERGLNVAGIIIPYVGGKLLVKAYRGTKTLAKKIWRKIFKSSDEVIDATKNGAKNVLNYEEYKRELRRQMSKPNVTDPDLAEVVDDLYRPGGTVGSGSTADAIRHELNTGQILKGKL
ncbi:MAG: hypothetical protein ACK2U3_00005, partial [Anaerolineales bacterium]